MQEISPRELAQRLRHEKLTLLDVREPWEFEHCHIEGSLLVPLGELPARLDGLPRELPIVTVCHHGMRSHHAAEFLLAQGYPDVVNLRGGIHRWANEVEPRMPQY